MSETIKIRHMEKEDLKQVHEIELLSHPTPWKFMLLEDEWKQEKYHYSFVAELSEKKCIVGYCFIWGWEGVDMTISNIAVHHDYRHQGTGSLLMDRIIQTAQEKKCASVLLEVRESNTIARQMYQNYGFTPVGKRRDYYNSPTEDGLVLRLPLQQHHELED
jgi:ribosomal-protein-alanine N-acetyltransferase